MAFQIEPNILFDTIKVEMPAIKTEKVEKWIELVIHSYGKELGEVQYIFCDDAKILEVNLEYLQHDYYTDIITFDYCVENIVSGDLFISVDTVQSNAEKFGEDYLKELLRVVVHGVLHLCGLKDKSPDEASKMRSAEEKALTIYNTL